MTAVLLIPVAVLALVVGGAMWLVWDKDGAR